MRLIAVALSCVAWASAQAGSVPDSELLRYRISYANAINIGEAQISVSRAATGAELTFQATVPIPGFPVAEFARSLVSPEFCTQELEKKAVRGKRHTDEKTTFDVRAGRATRQTTVKGGGSSTLPITGCARDALAFLFNLRKTLAEGESTVYYGAPYKVAVKKVAQKSRDNDRFDVRISGPSAKWTAELYLARDAARTPVLIRVPLTAGSLVVELAR
jgi:hypothetical protein